ncbi:MAG: hypothetical protein M3P82_02910, partial [Bacteroidota bacterium]|nr:hypothetical protein [Bacteroidota bacterium]
AGVYLIIARKFYWFILLIIAGTLATEKIIIIFPFMAAYLFVNKISIKNSLLFISSSVIAYLILSFILRNYTPSNTVSYLWIPDSKFILQNIYRPKTYLSFIITLGIPGSIVLISLFRFSKKQIMQYSYYYIGCFTSVLLYVYSIFSAWSDGRTLWTMYPFAIPLSVLFLQYMEKRKVN